MNSLLKTRDIADLYQVTTNTVLNWIYDGKLKAHRKQRGRYRIAQRDLETFARIHRQPPMMSSDDCFNPRLLLVEVGAEFFEKFRHVARSRWSNAKVVHAHTLFDARYLFERLHPDYIIVHPVFTPAPLLAHYSQIAANTIAGQPLLITLSDSVEKSIPICIKQIDRDAIARYSHRPEMRQFNRFA